MPRPLTSNPRSNVVTLRVTPKMRWGLELLAKQRGETLTEVVIHAVDRLFRDTDVGLVRAAGQPAELDLLDQTWAPEECERVVRLAMACPELLDDRQRYLWLRVRDERAVWKRWPAPRKPKPADVDWSKLRRVWTALVEEQ